ncbi:hypothetical protein NIES267_30480 [Calothrix parasitica NIES-267]|uniref:Uncharacterized protein n=1 Tax=Calothrix parasitica NIES-267 TaxID=1973488 RepID=A0A1Z4LQP6_9CYAN|nr:hypothetical protein NIES267_30480 [Calothrix parasitica NIES-267]
MRVVGGVGFRPPKSALAQRLSLAERARRGGSPVLANIRVNGFKQDGFNYGNNLKSQIRLEKFWGRKPTPQTFRKIQNLLTFNLFK